MMWEEPLVSTPMDMEPSWAAAMKPSRSVMPLSPGTTSTYPPGSVGRAAPMTLKSSAAL